jgi:rubrerythrin
MGALDTLADALSRGERGAVQYRCRRCDRTFAYSAAVEDPDCPYCAAPTLEPTADR